MPTSFPMSTPHAPTGSVTQAALDTAFTTPINDAAALAVASGQGYIADSSAGAAVTLGTTSAFASTTSVTYTPATTRRVKIEVSAIFTAAAAGRFLVRAAYNTGSSPVIGSATTPGQAGVAIATAAGTTLGLPGAATFGTALLTGGTQYTFYASIQRQVGGTTGDTAGTFYVLLTDLGSV